MIETSFPGFVPNQKPSEKVWCPLGKTVVVDSQGDAYSCPILRETHFKVGNVRDTSLTEIEKSERNRNLREEMLGRRHKILKCARCAWCNFCQGSCQAFTYLRTGSLYVNDEFCDFRRDLYREHVRSSAKGNGGNARGRVKEKLHSRISRCE